MPRKPKLAPKATPSGRGNGKFHIEFKNDSQRLAWAAFQQHDVLFLTGPAGVGKTHLACAFAIEQLLQKEKRKIVLTRPIVEAGESLGFLPGEFEEKVHPYMIPMYDCMEELVGREGVHREMVDKAIKIVPIAYMRGHTFKNSVCIFDEAQNATMKQLKMFLTRFDENSKIVVTGDPSQSDLGGDVALVNVMHRLRGIPGIGMVEFGKNSVVRHPLVTKIIESLES